MKAFFSLMRVHQWVKNLFVFVGLLFSFRWDGYILMSAIGAFFSFCCAASSVYILNDFKDIESDRLHPKKRYRPLAAGTVSKGSALAFSLFLIVVACMIAWIASIQVLFFVIGYFVINIAYTLWLKNEVILDVFCIFSGFMMRLLAGTVGIGIVPSKWLLITGMMITLFLGFGKRRAELAGGTKSRKILSLYSIPLLDKYIAICATATILTYGLYTVDSTTIAIHGTSNLIWTMPIVAFGIFRYIYLIHLQGGGEDTSRDLIEDIPMLLSVGLWMVSVLFIMVRQH
ncbi:decaprenyl-phosphate phosphoribosyltransferase [Jeongeupia chitinilytica]|uniref:decaprenyl-phosphate phosphoribosyltransferase n=1 Tax=Jeongeupia chitinilytica TaxID=1041641 RepID=UPI001E61ABE1|nr:decaprenyl-phosphate phosphoribosyltransferase [Jeongeupia chitinilytica]